MYTIGYIIYGYPKTEEIHKEIEKSENDLNQEWWEDSDGTMGFNESYSGNGEYSGYLGIVINTCDEVEPFNLEEVMKFTPTPEQIKTVDEKVEKLPDSLKSLLPERGVWLTWGSS